MDKANGANLHVLILEDISAEANLILHELREAGYALDAQIATCKADYLAKLDEGLDLILADYSLRDFSSLTALEILHEQSLDIPFIIISGTIGHDVAVEAMRHGAADCLQKDRMARLGQSVAKALEDRQLRIEEHKTRKALQQRAAHLTLISQIGQQISALLTLDELLPRAAHYIQEAFDYQHVAIFTLESGQDELLLRARAGDYANRFPPEYRMKFGQGIVGWVAQHGRQLVANDVSDEPRFHNPFGEELIGAELAVPIQAANQVVGVVAFFSRETGVFEENDVTLAQTLADQLAVAIQNARLYEELEGYSRFLEQAVREHTEELRRAKARVEAILNSVGEALMVIKPEGRIQQVNPAFQEQTGYSAREVQLQYYQSLLLDDDTRVRTFEEAKHSTDAGRTWRGDLRVRHKSGAFYDAAVTVAPLRDAQQDFASLVVTIRDISVHKEVERMKDAFVSNVSHELRTPITGLKLFLGLLEKAVSPDVRDEHLPALKRETERLNEIIEDVLRLSRLDQDRVELHLVPLDLNELVQQYLTDRGPLAESRGLKLTFSGLAELPSVYADAGLLGQALGVLLTNALNYTPIGGTILVSTQAEEFDSQLWSGFYISDDGPGIPPDEQDQLFERFFRGQVGRGSGAPGTGLGLSIAKEIVDRHEGRIEVANEGIQGKGVTFSVWLPVKE